MRKFKVALFDLDGTLIDTEPQYSLFWSRIGRRYHPEIDGFQKIIKGMTLASIFDKYFTDLKQRNLISSELSTFEDKMDYVYFEGVSNFIKDLRTNNIICAIVTSSNRNKIDSVRKKINNFEVFFDYIVTSEMFERSKPDPEPYLKAAQLANASSDECIVFEDSLNGIMSAKNAGMFTIGITTTNEVTKIKNLCDYTIDNYKELSFHKINFIINNLNI